MTAKTLCRTVRVSEADLRSIARSVSGSSQAAQKDRIATALELGGVTAADCTEHLGVTSPYGIINLLRNDGYSISTLWRWPGSSGHIGLYVLNQDGAL